MMRMRMRIMIWKTNNIMINKYKTVLKKILMLKAHTNIDFYKKLAYLHYLHYYLHISFIFEKFNYVT